jgi:hypothetical protein
MQRGLMTQFSRRSSFRSRISQLTSPHDVHPTDHDMRQRQLPQLFFEPRHKHVQLEGQATSLASAYLVRVTGAPVELLGWVECGVWSAIFFIASDSHIYHIYIHIYTTAIFIFNFITARTSCLVPSRRAQASMRRRAPPGASKPLFFLLAVSWERR